MPRYRSLDLWRGVACLMVVLFHSTIYVASARGLDAFAAADTLSAWLVAGTTVLHHGVTLFFVISGYCIAATADASLRRGTSTREYLKRRVRRIFPPYWWALGLTAVLLLLLDRVGLAWLLTEPTPGASETLNVLHLPSTLNGWQWAGNLSLMEFLRPQIAWKGGSAFILGQSWTLGYEEQFYWVVAALLCCVRSRRAFFAGATVVTIGVIVTSVTLPHGRMLGFFFDGAWLLFACGVAVYATLAYQQRDIAIPELTLAAIVAMLAGEESLAIGALYAVTLLALYPIDDRLMARVPSALHWCGQRCYSIYLVHWPITKAVAHGASVLGLTSATETILITTPLCVGLSLAVAAPFHAWIEQRWMNAPVHLPTPSDDRPPKAEPPPPPVSGANDAITAAC